MASFFNEDDSTDDEMGMNLQLAERLRINRENGRYAEDTSIEDSKELKQICNMHRKKFAQIRTSSSSSSVEVPSDNPSGASYDGFHNKKRQNGDKNVEQLGNPKRTCLSDRLRRSPEWKGSKSKTGCKSNPKHSKHSESIQMDSGSPVIKVCPRRKSGSCAVGLADSEDSDFEIPQRVTRSYKKMNGHLPKSCKNKPSSSDPTLETRPSTSFCFRNAFLESGSDDDSKSFKRNGALKGGKPECAGNSRLPRKVCYKFPESEESEEEPRNNLYRSKPLVFSSSDSEDEFHQSKPGKAAGDNLHPPVYENGFGKGSRNSPRQARTFRNNSKSNKNVFNSVSSSRAEQTVGFEPPCLTSHSPIKLPSERPCQAHRSPRMNLSAKLPSASPSHQSTAPVRGRRGGASSRSSRRTVSPQHHNLRSHNQRQDSRGRFAGSRSYADPISHAPRDPSLFNAEESENEFFTANSYSDTETSTESLGGVTINASFPSPRGGTISCSIEHDGDAGTDDEIIVLYSAGPYGRNNEARRGGPRTFGRRFSRGSTPHRQLHNAREVQSLSPDPVEQVRQLEEDERMARRLQAQFDAEVDPDYHVPLEPETEDVNDSDSDDDIIDPVGDSDSDEDVDHLRHLERDFGGIRHVNHFVVNRFNNPLSLGFGTVSNNRRFGNGRRRFQLSSRENTIDFQLARWFGLEVPAIGLSDEGLTDYESLLSLDDTAIGPRGLLKSDINRLPTRKFIHPNSASSAAGSSNITHKRTELNKECQVCLTDYETGDVLRILPCFHEFHTPCIDPWLKINQTCPVCRVRVDLDS